MNLPFPIPISILIGLSFPKISFHFPLFNSGSLIVYSLSAIASREPGTFLNRILSSENLIL